MKLGQVDKTTNYKNNGTWMNTNSRYIENKTSIKSSNGYNFSQIKISLFSTM